MKINYNMKKLAYFILFSFIPMFTFAQIDVVGPDGDVGIGTDTPLGKLHIYLPPEPLNTNGIPNPPTKAGLTIENGWLGFGVTNPARAFHMRDPRALVRIDRDRNSPGFLIARFPKFDYSGLALQSFGLITNAYDDEDGDGVQDKPGYMAITDFDGKIQGASQRVFLISQDGSLIVDNANAQDINAVVLSDYRLHVQGDAFKSDGGDLWNVLSDKRLKKNIKTYGEGIELIKKLNPVTYEYNGKAGTVKGKKQIGVVAQELQQVAPHMVSTYKFTTVNDGGIEYVDGRPDGLAPVVATEHEFLGINASSLKWIMVNAMKDQQKVIEQQEEDIADLKKELQDIKELLSSNTNDNSTSEASQTVVLSSQSELFQNQPNPFHETTVIKYTLPRDAKSAIMQITDMNGRALKTIQLENLPNGEVVIKAKELQAGTYSYSLIVDGAIINTKQMILTK